MNHGSLWDWLKEHLGGHASTPSPAPLHPHFIPHAPVPPPGPDPHLLQAQQSQQLMTDDLHQLGNGINALSVQYHQFGAQLDQLKAQLTHLQTAVIIAFALVLTLQLMQLVILLRQGAPRKSRR